MWLGWWQRSWTGPVISDMSERHLTSETMRELRKALLGPNGRLYGIGISIVMFVPPGLIAMAFDGPLFDRLGGVLAVLVGTVAGCLLRWRINKRLDKL